MSDIPSNPSQGQLRQLAERTAVQTNTSAAGNPAQREQRPLQQRQRPVSGPVPAGQRPMQPGNRNVAGPSGMRQPPVAENPQNIRPRQPSQQGVAPSGIPQNRGAVSPQAIPQRMPRQERPVSSPPPVQKQYDADMKVGTAAVDYPQSPVDIGVGVNQQENISVNREEEVYRDVPPPAAVANEKPSSPLNIPNLPPSVAAKMASVSKAAEEMGLDDNIVEKFNIPEKFLKVKSVIALLCCCLIVGVVIGAVLFSSDDNSGKQQQFTIGYIVQNPDVPANRGRCGAVELSRGCVLYIQNAERRERDAKDFYPLVEQLSGLNRFQIETANMRYAHRSIKPGYIAQFNIPALK